jgi:hypothetical protein
MISFRPADKVNMSEQLKLKWIAKGGEYGQPIYNLVDEAGQKYAIMGGACYWSAGAYRWNGSYWYRISGGNSVFNSPLKRRLQEMANMIVKRVRADNSLPDKFQKKTNAGGPTKKSNYKCEG